jgi:hypothetical protein
MTANVATAAAAAAAEPSPAGSASSGARAGGVSAAELPEAGSQGEFYAYGQAS